MSFFHFISNTHGAVHFLFQIFIISIVDSGSGDFPVIGVKNIVDESHFENDDFLVQVFGVMEPYRQTVDFLLVL
jgi:hypothetical protein